MIKGLILNLGSVYSLLAPVGLIFYPELRQKILMIWAVVAAVMYFAPPVGLLRPHKYSDVPHNRNE